MKKDILVISALVAICVVGGISIVASIDYSNQVKKKVLFIPFFQVSIN